MAIVSEAQIIKILQKYNPWWRNADAISGETTPQFLPPMLLWR